MTPERKAQIITRLEAILEGFQPTEEEPEPTMFWLISQYNEQYDNPELIGGDWVAENCPEPLAMLP